MKYKENEAFIAGRAVRGDTLGHAHVEKVLESTDDFALPMQQMITEMAWGQVWSRPGLERKTRSMLTVAMLTALNRPQELLLHMRGARNNGATPEELRELCLHAAVYAGFPAAQEAFRALRQVMADEASAQP